MSTCNVRYGILEYSASQIKGLAERTEQLNSENIKLLAALQIEQAKVSKLEGCVCDLEETGTQTADKSTYSVSTATDNMSKVGTLQL